jgi:hypothetical protein
VVAARTTVAARAAIAMAATYQWAKWRAPVT